MVQFRATLTNGDVFKALVVFQNAVGGLLDLYFDQNGLQSIARDERHVCIYDWNLPATAFTTYSCPKAFQLVLNTDNLRKGLQVSQQGDALEIYARSSDNDSDPVLPSKLRLTFSNAGFQYIIFTDTIDDRHHEQLNPIEDDSMVYDVNITMPTRQYSRMITDFCRLGQALKISCSRAGGVEFFSGDKKEGWGKMCLDYRSDSGADVRVNCKKNVSMEFSTQMMAFFALPALVAEKITMNLKCSRHNNEMSRFLMVEYDRGDEGYVKFFLAPKIGAGSDELELNMQVL